MTSFFKGIEMLTVALFARVRCACDSSLAGAKQCSSHRTSPLSPLGEIVMDGGVTQPPVSAPA
jgi:hypothetical protein